MDRSIIRVERRERSQGIRNSKPNRGEESERKGKRKKKRREEKQTYIFNLIKQYLHFFRIAPNTHRDTLAKNHFNWSFLVSSLLIAISPILSSSLSSIPLCLFPKALFFPSPHSLFLALLYTTYHILCNDTMKPERRQVQYISGSQCDLHNQKCKQRINISYAKKNI